MEQNIFKQENILKKNGVFDFDNAASTGIMVVDAIMNSINFYRKKFKAIETIYLNTFYWSEFIKWAEDNANKNGINLDEVAILDFDGVKIKKNPIRSNKEMEFAFYTISPGMATLGDKIIK